SSQNDRSPNSVHAPSSVPRQPGEWYAGGRVEFQESDELSSRGSNGHNPAWALTSRPLFFEAGLLLLGLEKTPHTVEAAGFAKFAQRLNPRLHQRGDLTEIAVAENIGTQGRVKVFRRECPKIFAVEPAEFCQVEDGAAEANIFDLESLHHLFERKLLSDGTCA